MLKNLIKISIFRFIMITFMFAAFSINAKKIENLYQIDIAIDQQSNQARRIASLEGLKKVLVRRSGSSEILNTPEASNGYKKVTSYLQKFEYSNNPSDESQYLITLYFEPRLIDDLIKRANKPLWDFNRPVTIFWIAQESQGEDYSIDRRIITENDKEQDLTNLIKENSARRGVPVILPLMDLEDELLVNKSDVWGRFPSSILLATERYSADAVIIGKTYFRGSEWFGQFSYLNENNKQDFDIQADKIEDLYATLVDNLAEILCNKYCITNTQSEGLELLIAIENITNFKTYKKVESYLTELSVVHSLQVERTHQDVITFKVGLLSDVNAVRESLSLNHQLKAIEDELELSTITIPEEKQLNDDDFSLPQHTSSLVEDTEKLIETDNKLQSIYYRWIH